MRGIHSRHLLTSIAASTLAVAVLAAPAPARAQSMGTAARLGGVISELERLNCSRPRDEVQAAITHQLMMLRDRAYELNGGQRPAAQVLAMMDEGFYAVAQYNQNGRAEAPGIAGRVDQLLAEARSLTSGGGRYQGNWNGGRGRGGGYGGYGNGGYGYGGYGNGGYGNGGYGNGGSYVPPPRPAERYRPTAYVPAPPAAYNGHGRY